jgi:dipeptidyl aminopeptidase/acylaminoacyl peptidase
LPPPPLTPYPSITPGPTVPPGGGDDIVFDYFTVEGAAGSRTDLFVVAADGSNKRQLTNTATMSEAQPNWSPERRRVAYTVTQADPQLGPWQLAVVDLNTGQSRVITPGREQYEPDWRPDGSLIAFTSLSRSGTSVVSSELAVIAPDGSGYRALVRVNSSYYYVGNPSWSPDGLQIAFTLESGTNGGELYVLDVAAMTARKLLDHPGWDDIDPAWSPDGRYVAFASGVARGSVTATYHTIWVLDRTTGVAGAIVTVPEWDLRGPSWSTDGREIVFSARFQVNPSRWALYVVPSTGGAVRGALSVGVEPDWGSVALVPLPTPMPGATATPSVPPTPPTFPPPPTDVLPPVTPGPSPTAPLPPTFPPPTIIPPEPTLTDVPTVAPSPSATATPIEATPSPVPTVVVQHLIYLPRADYAIAVP